MKVKKTILTILIALLLIVPFNIKAAGETDNQVIINFFHGDGCPHCAEAQEFFDSIEEQYGSKYKLVKYEVWNNTKNQELMEAVANYLNDDAGGVPFIIIGEKTFVGYAESYDKDIIAAIETEYAKNINERVNVTDKVDVVGEPDSEEVKEEEGNGALAAIVFLAILSGFAGIILLARQKNTNANKPEPREPRIIKIEKEDTIEEVKEEKKEPKKNDKTKKQKTKSKKKQ